MKVDENGGKRIENWLKWMKVHIKGMKMVGSGWNGMKMDESWWKWMNSDESCWKWMKEYESGQKWAKMDGSGWKEMKADEMNESVWKGMKMVWRKKMQTLVIFLWSFLSFYSNLSKLFTVLYLNLSWSCLYTFFF